ncbi:Helicase conserved C-terminal domain-containing protein [Quadrisphaera granulorum]|uniref:Helicase-like protein n=1 Tax=Quadrisphaera granulorum TaxID=317664 RepID=A0A316A1J1_9ACTN|nr:helicase-like protein [Quadrisphaera granulorum]SZE97753.1 Helicase conserved C-terminal domain-containing protein [Quadrisphaera granulorum]
MDSPGRGTLEGVPAAAPTDDLEVDRRPDLPSRLPSGEAAGDPDAVFEAFEGWATDRGLSLYPAQEEALIEVVSGSHVVLATPTGSGKSLVALGAHAAAMASGRRSVYTAPIKALVSEKFFALVEVLGAQNVGMVTGDGAVNAAAPVVCCTAEVLANRALREGADLDVGLVVMDEFHYYADRDRGWAWQVPLLELTRAQFLLMSATLGDTTRFTDDLLRRTGTPAVLVAGAERPVPLHHRWAMTPVHETLEELLEAREAPVYVVHPTQAAALERAQALLSVTVADKGARERIGEALGGFRFTAGFGQVLSKLVRHGVGVHHAGMLPKYRRLVETLAQEGLLPVICGTDTLGVGINVPIRSVLVTSLTKFDGRRTRLLSAREFHQIAGRAGRAGFDTSGTCVVQAPDHLIENERALAKAGDDPKKRRKVVKKKPPEGEVSWAQPTFERLVAAAPEPLTSQMCVTHAMVLNTIARPAPTVPAFRRLLRDNHSDRATQVRLVKRAIAIVRELLAAGVVEKLPEPDDDGRTLRLTVDLQADFALNQPLSTFAVAALDVLDPTSPTPALDVVSVVEATLDDPRPILLAQQFAARGEAVAAMKAEGIEYEERMELLEEITWPKPLEELLGAAFEQYRQSAPWLPEDALSPKSVVREMLEQAMTFGDLVRRYNLTRSEGAVLRYLSDAYRALRQTVPEDRRVEGFDDVIEWLGEVVRQTDSSLLDEWEALTHPEALLDGTPPPPPALRGITANVRAFTVQVRNAMWQRVDLLARRRAWDLAQLDPALDLDAWQAVVADYYAEHDDVGVSAASRAPALLQITHDREARLWQVRQVVDDPAGDHDWGFLATVDLEASDLEGTAVIAGHGLQRM